MISAESRQACSTLESEAAHWLVELQAPNVSLAEISAWQSWLSADPAHAAAFERIENAWLLSSQAVARAIPWPSDDETRSDAYDGSVPISDWIAAHVQRPLDGTDASVVLPAKAPRRRFGLRTAIAAPLLLLVAGFALLAQIPLSSVEVPAKAGFDVQTRRGEIREVVLSDGTSVTLGADSRLSATLDERRRLVQLERGEAFFQVTKDLARPFTVVVGDRAVTAIGTAFDVRRVGARIVVAVSEGVVSVIPNASNQRTVPSLGEVRLGAGEELSLGQSGAPVVISRVHSASVASWREGRLQYLGEPLEAVVADVQRYSMRKIEFGDPTIAPLRVTGTVFIEDLDPWFRSLEVALSLRVIELPEGIVRITRAPPTESQSQ